MTTPLATISADSLSSVTGAGDAPPGFLTRSDFQAGGRNAAEAATVGAGAAGGFYLGGPGGAFTGATGAELLNRSGVTGSAGDWAGGKVFDAISSPPSFNPDDAAQP